MHRHGQDSANGSRKGTVIEAGARRLLVGSGRANGATDGATSASREKTEACVWCGYVAAVVARMHHLRGRYEEFLIQNLRNI